MVSGSVMMLKKLSAACCKSSERLFPHTTTVAALQECETQILTTDGSYEASQNSDGEPLDPDHAHPGSVVIAIPPGGPARWTKLDDASNQIPVPPTEI